MLQNGVADLTARFVWELFSFYNTVLVSQWACRLQRALSVRACSLCAFRRWRLRCGELRDENNGNNRTYTWREPNRYCQTSFNAKDFPWICYQNGYHVQDPWKTFCCPWIFSNAACLKVLEQLWNRSILNYITLNIQQPRLKSVIEQHTK